MAEPKFIIRRSSIQLSCDRNDGKQNTTANLIEINGKVRQRDSAFWGTPTFTKTGKDIVGIELPMNVRNLTLLRKYGAVPDMSDIRTARRIGKFELMDAEASYDLPATIVDKLMPFQEQGATWLLQRNLTALLAFDAGLGKTLTALTALHSDPDNNLPCVVIAPAHVKLNWQGEWVKWGFNVNDTAVLFGRTPDANAVKDKKLIILNQHILVAWHDVLCKLQPKTLVIDEAHSFVKHNTKTYPYVAELTNNYCDKVMMLTATPLVNDLGNFWGLCNLLNPDLMGTRKTFIETFMPEEKAKQRLLASRWRGGFGAKSAWRDVAMARLPKKEMARRIGELSEMLHEHVVLRKKRKEVIKQLPKVIETRLRLDIREDTPEGRRFWQADSELRSIMAEAKEDMLASTKLLGAMAKMRVIAAETKMPDVQAWLESFLAESDEDQKVVVVGWSVAPLEALHAKFKKISVIVNGTIDAKKKHLRGKEFAEDPKKRILFGNVKSIGTGIDLVSASTMLITELPMTAVDFEQVKGRIDRLSQTSDNLSYYYMTIKDSIEEKQGWAIINRKQKLTEDLGL